MTSSSPVFRSFIVYAICLPLAIFLGVRLTNPMTYGSFAAVGAVLFVLAFPLLLRFHHPLLVLGWNVPMIVFFLPGAPTIWLPLAAISFTISIIHRAIDQKFRFISVPELTRPIIALAIVIIVTAQATGGIKLRSLGGDVFGGKRYIILLGSVVGYFALTARRIPPRRAHLFVTLFLLGGLTALIGDVVYFRSSSLQFIYWLFPPSGYLYQETDSGMVRFAGVNTACSLMFAYMLAKYGIRGIFNSRTPWRLGFFAVFIAASALGGFRSTVLYFFLVFAVQFYLEGLHKTRLLGVFLLCLILAVTLTLPFVQHLPYSVQRTLSVLPIPVDPTVRFDADASSEWRLNIWKAVLPQVPRYLLLGKGLALSSQDFDFSFSTFSGTTKAFSEDQNWAALAGEYHSGPLSVIIPFGLWGAIAFVWFLVAGFRVLYRNYKYGIPELRVINAFLLATFVARIALFLSVYGSFHNDMQSFVGYLALSVCLNGGVARPEPQAAPDPEPEPRFRSLLHRPRLAPGRHT